MPDEWNEEKEVTPTQRPCCLNCAHLDPKSNRCLYWLATSGRERETVCTQWQARPPKEETEQ